MLAWWRHVAPTGSLLRTVAVFEGDSLVGIAPFFARKNTIGLIRYRLLAAGLSPHLQPLAQPGAEHDVANVMAAVLAAANPAPHVITLDGINRNSPWRGLLRQAWPSRARPWVRESLQMPAPFLSLEGRTYDQWWSSIDTHLRRELRRRRRRLEERGAAFRLAESPGAILEGLSSFLTLHYGRWSERGGSGVLVPGVEEMLLDAAKDLVGELRFRLWSIEVDGRAISSQIFLGAGGELSYWLGGFAESWARYGPSIQAVRVAIEHAWIMGDRRIDFGAGGQDYKYGFADAEDAVQWVDLGPYTPRYPLTRLEILPGQLRQAATHVRHAVYRRLPSATQQRLKRVRQQLARSSHR